MILLITLILLITASIVALWAAAWSFRPIGVLAIGPIFAGSAAGFCLVIVGLVCLTALPPHEDRRQPELSAAEAASVARAETMLQCRRQGGEAALCDGYTPALLDRTCDHSLGVVLLSDDEKVVRRVAVGGRGSFDGLSGGDDDPSPGELERLRKRSKGSPMIDDNLKYCVL